MLGKLYRAGMGAMDRMDRHNLGLIAAGVGFFSMLAIFPAIAAVVMVWSLVADPAQIDALIALGRDVMPAEVHAILARQVQSLAPAGAGGGLGWATLFSLGLALWSARAGVAALIRGLNAAYGTDHRPNMLRRVLAAAGLTLVLCAVAIFAIAAVVVAPIALALLPLGPFATVAAEVVRWILALAIIVFALGLIYRYGPNLRGHRPAWLTPGAAAAAALWLVVSVAFSVYLANFGSYNEVYGSLGAAVALLMWFYLSAYVVLLGGVLNAELDPYLKRRRAARDEARDGARDGAGEQAAGPAEADLPAR